MLDDQKASQISNQRASRANYQNIRSSHQPIAVGNPNRDKSQVHILSNPDIHGSINPREYDGIPDPGWKIKSWPCRSSVNKLYKSNTPQCINCHTRGYIPVHIHWWRCLPIAVIHFIIPIPAKHRRFIIHPGHELFAQSKGMGRDIDAATASGTLIPQQSPHVLTTWT